MRASRRDDDRVKSGYGLTLDDELARCASGAGSRAEGVARTTTSLLGAHAVPPERKGDRRAYVDEVVEEMIPEAARARLADACDVYCDEGAFDRDEARRVLEAARAPGLARRAHVGQFADLGGAELCAELGALSADHLEAVSDAGLRALAAARAWSRCSCRARGGRCARRRRTRRGCAPSACASRSAPTATPGPARRRTCRSAPPSPYATRASPPTTRSSGSRARPRARPALRARGRSSRARRRDLALYDLDDPYALVYALGDIEARAVWLGGRPVHEAPSNPLSLW